MRSRPPRHLVVLLALGLAAGCTTNDTKPAAGGKKAPAEEIALRLVSSLKPFDACGDLLEHVKTQAAAHADSYGAFGGDVRDMADRAEEATAAPTAEMADTGSKSQSQPEFSGTNVQEAGVDEPDTVKTDGRRLFTIAGGRLQALEITDGDPRLAGSLELPADSAGSAQLLLAGEHLLVMSSGWSPTPLDAPTRPGIATDKMAPGIMMPGQEQTVLRLVDVSDPAHLRIISTLEVDGHVAGARMVGEVVRLVTTASPSGLNPVYPQGTTNELQSSARDQNVRQVQESTLVNWLPSFRLVNDNGSTKGPAVTSGLLVACDRVSRPAEFSGLGTVSVLTFDLSASNLGDGDATSVLADGQTVYASATGLYVATTRYDMAPVNGDVVGPTGPEVATEIHKFDISGAGPARHSASGRVKGQVLNQFSFSEHDGFLRVATTQGSGGDGSESFVTILAERDGELATVGMVGNLGRGERIYAVRFLGDVGYVVTFRQTDPLYTIDLSDPTRPLVVGELKIPGFSAYLHPVGDGLLLGIGQDATATGGRLGTQVSLFDVSDPAHPQRLDQAALGSGASAVEYDHHAFLWWGPSHLAVVPVQSYDGPSPFNGVVGFRATRDNGVDELGRVIHQPAGAQPQGKPSFAPAPPEMMASPIQRSLVIGDVLYTLSDAGVMASGLSNLARLGWVAFAA